MLVIGLGEATGGQQVAGPAFTRVGRDAGLVVAPGEDLGATWSAILTAAAGAPGLEGVVLPECPVTTWRPFEETSRHAFGRGGRGLVTFAYGPSTLQAVLVPGDCVAEVGPLTGATFPEAAGHLAERLAELAGAAPAAPAGRVVGAAMVKNECDIIEQFVRHNLGVLDALFIIENGSTDGTREILEALEAEGLPVAHRVWTSVGYEQSRIMTQAARWAADLFAADWIVPIDADEFLVEEAPGDLRRGLAGGGLVRALPWHGFVPMTEDPLAGTGSFRARTLEPRQFFKVLVRPEMLAPGGPQHSGMTRAVLRSHRSQPISRRGRARGGPPLPDWAGAGPAAVEREVDAGLR